MACHSSASAQRACAWEEVHLTGVFRKDSSRKSCLSNPSQSLRSAVLEVKGGHIHSLASWEVCRNSLAAEEPYSHGCLGFAVTVVDHLVSKYREPEMLLIRALASGQSSLSLSYLHWIYLVLHLSAGEDLLCLDLEARDEHSRDCWQHLLL